MNGTCERDLGTVEVAAELGVDGDTVRGWIEHGVPVAGQTVRLAAYRVGRLWRVCRESLREFVRACNAGREVELPRDRAQRRQREEGASASLDRRLGTPRRGKG